MKWNPEAKGLVFCSWISIQRSMIYIVRLDYTKKVNKIPNTQLFPSTLPTLPSPSRGHCNKTEWFCHDFTYFETYFERIIRFTGLCLGARANARRAFLLCGSHVDYVSLLQPFSLALRRSAWGSSRIVSPDFHLHFRCTLYTRDFKSNTFKKKRKEKRKEGDRKKGGTKKTKNNIYERPSATASDFRVRDFYFHLYISPDYYTIILLISFVRYFRICGSRIYLFIYLFI